MFNKFCGEVSVRCSNNLDLANVKLMVLVQCVFADSMEKAILLHVICGVLAVLVVSLVKADDPYRYYTWTVTYGTLSPLGVPQQVGNSKRCDALRSSFESLAKT